MSARYCEGLRNHPGPVFIPNVNRLFDKDVILKRTVAFIKSWTSGVLFHGLLVLLNEVHV